MIVTFSTTLPNGSSSSTAGTAFHGKATTARGSSRRRRACRPRQSRNQRASRRCTPSSNGCAPTLRAGRRRARRASLASRSFPATSTRSATRRRKSSYRSPSGSGAQGIEFHGVSKVYGERLLIDNLSFSVPPGAIVGVIGPNGAGKSTLFRMITGAEKPDKGKIIIGSTAKLAVVDQSREALPDAKTAWEAISGGLDILTVGKFEMPSRAYLRRFNFKGVDQQKNVGQLSGGERGRLHLAITLLKGGNVLLLDEPSNDLDVETLRALEDALIEFAGSVMVISHDRWFLDRIATHILAFEGDSQVNFFEGNYQEYEADKKKRLGEEGARPHRLRYKALMSQRGSLRGGCP